MKIRGIWTYYHPSKDCPIPKEAVITRMVIGPARQIWMSTLMGRDYTTNGLPISALKTIGMLKFDQAQWNFYPLGEAGLPKGDIRNIVCDSTGKVWLDIPPGGTCRFDGQIAEIFNKNERGLPPSGYLHAFAVGDKGDVWAAWGVAGVYHFDGSVWNRLPLEVYGFAANIDDTLDLSHFMRDNLFSIPDVTHVAVDHAGYVWFVVQVETEKRVIFLRYNGIHLEEVSSVIIEGNVTALAVDRQGAVWVGWSLWQDDFENSLWMLSSGETEWIQYTLENSALTGPTIESLCVDKRGRVWAGTADGFTIFEGTESMNWEVIRPGISHESLTKDDLTREDMYKVNEARAKGEESPFVWINRYGAVDEQGRVWVQAGHNGVAMLLED